MADGPGDHEHGGLLDEAERQSIRDWFRRLARLRGPTSRPETGMSDLQLPPDLAADVRGGAGGPPSPPDEFESPKHD